MRLQETILVFQIGILLPRSTLSVELNVSGLDVPATREFVHKQAATLRALQRIRAFALDFLDVPKPYQLFIVAGIPHVEELATI